MFLSMQVCTNYSLSLWVILAQASMTREKFPEKVPFRLTRMMIKAMEVSGIEGNFR